jgi:hypothetical protein
VVSDERKPADDAAQANKPVAADEPAVRKAFVSVSGALAGTATFIVTILGAVFLVVPSWRPLSRDKIQASLTVPAVESKLSTRGWAHRQFPGRGRADEELRRAIGAKPTANQLNASGTVVYVRLQVDGFKRRAIRLRARLYYADTKQPANNGVKQAYPTNNLKIDAPSRSSVQLLFLKDLSDLPGEKYFVRVEAYDGGGILAYADSGTILDGHTVGPPPPS